MKFIWNKACPVCSPQPAGCQIISIDFIEYVQHHGAAGTINWEWCVHLRMWHSGGSFINTPVGEKCQWIGGKHRLCLSCVNLGDQFLNHMRSLGNTIPVHNHSGLAFLCEWPASDTLAVWVQRDSWHLQIIWQKITDVGHSLVRYARCTWL